MFTRFVRSGLIALFAISASTLAAPPHVVKTVPAADANDVDPSTREIRVTFDQPMDHGGYSIVGGGPAFPKLIGKPRWADGKTIVIAVRLEANHEYRLGFNSATFQNFVSKNKEPAEPFALVFKTGAGKKRAVALTPQQNKEAIVVLREAIDQDYSYRDRLHLDWDKLFSEGSPAMESAKTPREFAEAAAKMLAAAQDLHLWLKVEDSVIPTWARRPRLNLNLKTLQQALPHMKRQSQAVWRNSTMESPTS